MQIRETCETAMFAIFTHSINSIHNANPGNPSLPHHLISEQGRLFGIVNEADMLVIRFDLPTLVAGVALVTSGTEDTDQTAIQTPSH